MSDTEREGETFTHTHEPLPSKPDLQIERGTTRKSHDRLVPSRHRWRLFDATLPLPAEYALHVLFLFSVVGVVVEVVTIII